MNCQAYTTRHRELSAWRVREVVLEGGRRGLEQSLGADRSDCGMANAPRCGHCGGDAIRRPGAGADGRRWHPLRSVAANHGAKVKEVALVGGFSPRLAGESTPRHAAR